VCTKEELRKKVSAPEVDAIFDRKVAEAERAVRVKTKTGTKKVVARGLVKRRAEESAPFRGAATRTTTASK
jgi:GH24 family phage-related lysozyme (muramidase)